MTNQFMNHVCRVGDIRYESDEPPEQSDRIRPMLEPWLSAILQSEHLSLLVGNGLTTAATFLAGGEAPSMASELTISDEALNTIFNSEVIESAEKLGRGSPNIEDFLRIAISLEAGLRIAGDSRADLVSQAIQASLSQLISSILLAESTIRGGEFPKEDSVTDLTPVGYLVSLLLTFASRTPNRDRLHLFTTNYDRVIEFTCEVSGIRIIDRFIGTLNPRFRASRMDIDLHYNPPGVRGEPRFLEGVVRVTKLHGSVDWKFDDVGIVRVPIEFGSQVEPDSESVLIYPSAAKDQETSYYPYAELFRDFSAAVCRPNSVVVTYGYGFGDDHINRILADMLTIPSTHVLVISYDDAGGKVERFLKSHGNSSQISLLIGPHFADLQTLVDNYLPKPAIDDITWRRAALIRNRAAPGGNDSATEPEVDVDHTV